MAKQHETNGLCQKDGIPYVHTSCTVVGATQRRLPVRRTRASSTIADSRGKGTKKKTRNSGGNRLHIADPKRIASLREGGDQVLEKRRVDLTTKANLDRRDPCYFGTGDRVELVRGPARRIWAPPSSCV